MTENGTYVKENRVLVRWHCISSRAATLSALLIAEARRNITFLIASWRNSNISRMEIFDTIGIVLIFGVILLFGFGLIRDRLLSRRKPQPEPKFEIGRSVAVKESESNSVYQAKIVRRDWHHKGEAYVYWLDGKSKRYVESDLSFAD